MVPATLEIVAIVCSHEHIEGGSPFHFLAVQWLH